MAKNPGMRMMMLNKLREPESRSEYGGGDGRRMIGYDRAGPSPGRERHMPPMDGPGGEWGHPPMGGPRPGWDVPPMGMGGMYGGGREPYGGGRESYGGGREPYGGGGREPYGGGPEARRRRDRRGRYMMGDMGPDDDDDDDDKYRLKGGKMITGAVWMDSVAPEKVDERKAMEWTRKMQNPDGSTGPHFKPEIADQFRNAHCPGCDKWEFFVAINMMYADYSEVAKKFAADKPEFYVHMAKAFLEDPDAGKGKLTKYMEIIPK